MGTEHIEQIIRDELAKTHNTLVRLKSAKDGRLLGAERYSRLPVVGDDLVTAKDSPDWHTVTQVVQYPHSITGGDGWDRKQADVFINALRDAPTAPQPSSKTPYVVGGLVALVALGGIAWFATRPTPTQVAQAAKQAATSAAVQAAAAAYPNGTILQGAGNDQYVVQNGHRRWIPDTATITALGFNPSNVVAVSDAVLAQVPLAPALPSSSSPAAAPAPAPPQYLDGTLLKGSGAATYVMRGRQAPLDPGPRDLRGPRVQLGQRDERGRRRARAGAAGLATAGRWRGRGAGPGTARRRGTPAERSVAVCGPAQPRRPGRRCAWAQRAGQRCAGPRGAGRGRAWAQPGGPSRARAGQSPGWRWGSARRGRRPAQPRLRQHGGHVTIGDDALKGYGTAAAVAGTTVAVTAVAAPAAAAAAALAISTAIGTAIPIPLLGTAIGAIVGAFTAMGIAIKGALLDSFHPDAPVSAGWLLLFQIAPGLVYGNVDTINTETGDAAAHAARLVRYFRLVGGIVPNSNGVLYNPNETCFRTNNLPTDDCQTNPYLEASVPDPGEPLTDINVTQRVGDLVRANGHRPANPAIPSMLTTPAQAQAALGLLRNPNLAASGVFQWSVLNLPGTMADLRASVAKIRLLAGEQGPDPYLENLLGGSVTPAVITEGTLLKGSGPAVYVVQQGKRKWIPDLTTFTAFGYDWGKVMNVADANLNSVPMGSPFGSVQPQPQTPASAPLGSVAFSAVTASPAASDSFGWLPVSATLATAAALLALVWSRTRGADKRGPRERPQRGTASRVHSSGRAGQEDRRSLRSNPPARPPRTMTT